LVTFLRAVAREASADGVSPAAADGRTAALRVLFVAVIATAVWFGVFPGASGTFPWTAARSTAEPGSGGQPEG